MLINSVVLVLREVLEAALLLSVMLALSLNLRCSMRWLALCLPLAVLGIGLFAVFLDSITDALEGTGQELLTAGLQLAAFAACLLVICLGERVRAGARQSPLLALGFSIAVICAMVREGAEIYLYVTAFAASPDQRTAVYVGAVIGAGIGVSLGVLAYGGLRAMSARAAYVLCLCLVAVIGAGLVVQSSQLLEQIDWIAPGEPLWNTSAWLSEESVPGQLLYAVVGYEASPAPLQAWLWLGSALAVPAAWWLGRAPWRQRRAPA
ncbi:hypothetical protein E4634_03795 [Mangrovimicrobium sediminis]|uniref:Iron permease n=1 Tax=Mangrovimicrobium sediminis TaxID=2562682 RepID=A0A4Z0M6K1_9GAMM|nr:FTR1 family protein [Haliea sp. SAOS-164]TGD75139.1 hypothetical protein E4634_03795 [Haliea sp. SAOS-164]